MIKTTMKIEGMMCGMCEAHVCDAIRKAVESAGFECGAITLKKGLLG